MYSWTDHIVLAIQDELIGTISSENLHIEYMDSRRRPGDQQYFELLRDYYLYKHRNIRFDVIITSDDNAFNFLAQYRDELYPDVPVVFCGVNNFDPALDTESRWHTGIIEGLAIEDNLDLITRVHPDVREILLLSDSSPLGLSIAEQARQVRDRRNGGSIKLEVWNDFTLSQLQERLQALEEGTVVFLMILQRDNQNRPFSYTDDLPQLSTMTPVPIYGQWGVELGNGILGGMLNDAGRHGRNAAQLARRVLDGTDVHSIAIKHHAAYLPGFDHLQLQRFSITNRRIPAGSHIANRPISFFEKHRRLVLASTVVFIFLVSVIFWLLFTIRQRRRVEQRFRDNEQKYRQLFEQATDAIVVYDQESLIIIDANPAAEKLFEISAQEASTRTVEEFLVTRDNLEPDFRNVPKTKGQLFNTRFRTSTGDTFQGEFTAGVFQRAGKNHIIVDIRNVSERQQLEEQLRQSQKMEALGVLAGGIAHDFNNILTAIFGFGDLLETRIPDDSEALENLAQMQSAADRARDLVSQILTFASKTAPTMVAVDVARIVEDTVALLRVSLPSTITIKAQCESDWTIIADATQIQQVLMNLCTNAVQAMDQGSGRLTIGTANAVDASNLFEGAPDTDNQNFVHLWVEDTGTGIEKSVREKVFDPFFSTKGPGKGTGMGLSVVMGVVKKHDGYIGLKSKPGKGTVFHALLPASHHVDVSEERASRSLSMGHGERVLVVDDEPIVADTIGRLLRMLAYSPTVVTDSVEALEIFRKDPSAFDLVVSDLTMPQMDGGVLAARLFEIRKDVPVLICTGYGEEANLGKLRALGVKNIVSKPLRAHELAVQLCEILGDGTINRNPESP